MKVIIPVAGKGTRMRPHTHTKIKPFICVAGKPSLGYIMDALKEFDELQRNPSSKIKNPSPISEIIFIIKHLKEQVEEFIKKNYDFKMRFVEQKVADGTAGAINLAKPFVDEPVLIIFADTVFEADLGDINKLKEDRIKAMKERDIITKSILSVLHSDSLSLAKKEMRDVTEQDIITSAKTLIKRNEQTIKLVESKKDMQLLDKLTDARKEILILQKFLPVQMTDEEIKIEVDNILKTIPEDDLIKKNQGIIMSQLKKFGDSINMGIASKYVTSKLK